MKCECGHLLTDHEWISKSFICMLCPDTVRCSDPDFVEES